MSMELPLYEQIYNFLFEKIRKGELKTGDRLPSEKELADQFDVSRITSKRALEMLSSYGIVERIQGKGSFVATTLPNLHEVIKTRQESNTVNSQNSGEHWPVIGVILPDFADSYGTRLLHGIEERCSQLGIRIMMKLTYDKLEEEELAIRSFINLGVDGMIIFPVHGEHYNPDLLRLFLDQYPLIFIDRYLKGIATSAIYTDNRKATMEITNYLFEKGQRQIGFVSAPADDTSTIEDRLKGFTDAYTHQGEGLKPDYIMTNLYSSLPRSFEASKIQVDFETIRRFVESNPELTAFVVVEYNLALILREVLLTMGKKIPEDYQIVCFDSPEQPFGKHLFTHVRQNEFEMGHKAVDMLQAKWNKEDTPLHNIIPHDIIVGRSTI